jgi:hypothetical protein
MNNLKHCPSCHSEKITNQPGPINNRQDVFFNCGGAVTYDIDNPDDFEETGICKNKIDWERIYIEYGEEFDEKAKSIDSRFYGWVELSYYKEYHTISWINENQDKNCTDQEFLDKYFENKELYISSIKSYFNNDKQLLDYDAMLELNGLKKVNGHIVIKNYRDYNFGELFLEDINSIEIKGYNKHVFRVVNSIENPSMIDGYIIDSIPVIGGKRIVEFYDKEIIDIIINKG